MSTFSFPVYPPPDITGDQMRNWPMRIRPTVPAYPLIASVDIDLDLSIHVYDGGAVDYTCSINDSASLSRVHTTPTTGQFWLRWETLYPPQRIANWSLTAAKNWTLAVAGAGIPGGATTVDVLLTIVGLTVDDAGTLVTVGWGGKRLVSGASDANMIPFFLPDNSGVLINSSREWNDPADSPVVTVAENWRDGGTLSFTSTGSFYGPGGITEDWTINDLTITFTP